MQRALKADRAIALNGDGAGLSSDVAAQRREIYGSNDIVEAPPNRWLALIQDTVRDPMIWFLLGTAVLFAVTGETGEALIMVGAIGPLIGMDILLHWRAQASTAGLRGQLADLVTVIRDGRQSQILARGLVPGDLVVVDSGTPFPADGLIVGGADLQVDESALTGEAFPVGKSAIVPTADGSASANLTDRNWGFAGTRLLTGTARLQVVDTGAETLYGEIVRQASQGGHERTPLQNAIGRLVTVLLVVAIAVCLILAWVRLEQGFGLIDALLSAVTLAVAAIPEEFPVVFTVFLGVGVYRLARRKALVRRAVVVENIGRINCICTDKTGTLTEGRLALAHYLPAPGIDNSALLETAALASRPNIGDPLDVAIAGAAGEMLPREAKLATFPFTEDRRRETAVVREAPGRLLAVTKGAPETILALCDLTPDEITAWRSRVQDLAGSGHKVIACARRAIADDGWPGGEPDRDYQFTGLLACEDSVRDGVTQALQIARSAGIKVVIVTGDHPATATAVALETGIGGGAPNVIDGERLDALIAAGDGALRAIDVVARAVPAQKVALVRAFQAQGAIVAVTGDGVNDVPALQAADIGFAMGEHGTRSAREVASVVLLDDNIRTVVNAVGEGRQLFRNLQTSFAYLIMIHMPLVLSAAIVPLAGYPLLYLPIHIVWLELVVHPTAMLVFQQAAPDGLKRIEPALRVRFFSRAQWLVVVGTGLLATALVLASYSHGLGQGDDAAQARGQALIVLVGASAGMAAFLSRLRTWTAAIVTLATVASAILFMQVPALADLMHLTPLNGLSWLAGLGGAAIAAAPALLLHRAVPRRSGTGPRATA